MDFHESLCLALLCQRDLQLKGIFPARNSIDNYEKDRGPWNEDVGVVRERIDHELNASVRVNSEGMLELLWSTQDFEEMRIRCRRLRSAYESNSGLGKINSPNFELPCS